MDGVKIGKFPLDFQGRGYNKGLCFVMLLSTRSKESLKGGCQAGGLV